jgi:hypothetical protein
MTVEEMRHSRRPADRGAGGARGAAGAEREHAALLALVRDLDERGIEIEWRLGFWDRVRALAELQSGREVATCKATPRGWPDCTRSPKLTSDLRI